MNFFNSVIKRSLLILKSLAAQAEGRPERMMETKITVRLCILSIIFALIGVAMLKIR